MYLGHETKRDKTVQNILEPILINFLLKSFFYKRKCTSEFMKPLFMIPILDSQTSQSSTGDGYPACPAVITNTNTHPITGKFTYLAYKLSKYLFVVS